LSTLADLKQDPENARAHNPRNIGMITNALHEVGAARSVVVDENNVLLAGHGVYEAAVEAGIENVQIVEADGNTIIAVKRSNLTAAAKKRLAFFDNRTAELADWNIEQMVADLDAGLDLAGIFREDELNEMLEGFADGLLGEEPPEPQIDKAEELREKWGVESGDLWHIPSKKGNGEHRIICGDCTDAEVVERVMQGEQIEGIISDPPYGIDWDTDYTRFSTEYGTKRVCHSPIVNDDKEFDPLPWLEYPKVVLWGANWYCHHIPIGTWLVWDKRHPNGTAWLSDAELGWMKGKRGVYLYAETVQGAHRKERAIHPTQKPVGLFEWCINKADMTDIVLDPFLGSGTTLVACERLGRFGRGIEVSPGYVAVSLERLHDLGLQPERVA